VKDFRGSDIDGVRRIAVDTGNAITRTSAGRSEIANQFLANGIIPQDPQGAQQYLQMISTGRLEPLTDRPDTKLRGIQSENDRLVLGESARVLITDDHVAHIEAHMSLLDEPSVRDDDEVSQAVLDHVQLHIELYQQASLVNPGLMTILGIPPFPGGPGEGMAPPMEGPNPGPMGGPPPGLPAPMAEDLPPGAPDIQAARMPTLPGQQGQYDPATGQTMEGV
jgi:hypothetical protein